MIKKSIPFLTFLLIIFYLLMNTPLISDEFCWIASARNSNFKDLLNPTNWFRQNIGGGWFIIAPIEYYLLYIWCHFFNIYNVAIISIIKVFYIALSFYLIIKFFSIFLNKENAFLASFLFIFFPSHDSTVFAYQGTYSTLTIAFYLYSFYLAYNNKLFLAFLMALIASFTSYASVPMSALSLFFFLNKEFKKGLVILIPNVIYSFYYILLSRIMAVTKTQIPQLLNLHAIMKQFALQIFTFIDSMLGPSMWLKIFYSFFQLMIPSIIIGIFLVVVFFKIYEKGKNSYNAKLVISLTAITLVSFLLFAITGMYPQLAFNLGNRTTIFGSLLITYLIILIPLPRKIKAPIFILMIFTILGISDHWKNWNAHQQKVITNIKNNQGLRNYSDNRVIYVTGNQYSRYGPISHIEFFSEDWVPHAVLSLALNKDILAKSLNKGHKYIGGYLIDTKYNLKTKVSDYINVYDSQKNILFKLNVDKLNSYVEFLPFDNRHWIQTLNIKFIKDAIKILMPRLKYAL